MRLVLFYMLLTLIMRSAMAQVCKEKNIVYADRSVSGFNQKRHSLDIYFPKDIANKKGVFVFFHGGSWKGGKKNTYRYLARIMAKKGFVAVLVNYRLSPEFQYEAMAEDCAKSLHWIDSNISKYGGDAERITVAGHSAGGHLAAYVSLGPTFKKLKFKNPVSKTILIDAFGLDMYSYFQEYNNPYSRNLFKTFSSNPEIWKSASPLYLIQPPVKIPFLILTGAKTYPAIIDSSEKFHSRIKAHGGISEYKVIQRKKHIGMIIQFISPRNDAYDLITSFMNGSLEFPSNR